MKPWSLSSERTGGIERSAVFSPCRTWRYTLERYWSDDPWVLFVLLNPSTADETQDDPTNRRAIRFARRWEYGGVVFVNLFAFRTPYPDVMRSASDPVGPENDQWISRRAAEAGCVVAAWGTHGGFLGRDCVVGGLLRDLKLWCLGTTKEGYPRHPLYVLGSTNLQRWHPGDEVIKP